MVILVATAIILLLIVLVAFFIVVYQRRMMEQKLRLQEIEAEAQRQKLAAIVDAQERERMRIAGDLHDGVGALLSTAKMSLNFTKRKLAKEGVENSLEESTSLLDAAIGSVREISHDLLPPSLEKLGLVTVLEQLADRTARLSGIRFECQVKGVQRRLPVRTELVLYRVAQELIGNALKHSQATELGLEVMFEAENLLLRFQDNGIGFDLVKVMEGSPGLGLRGMQSRMAALGGTIVLHSVVGKGSCAEISVGIET
jgi:two-component system, NarL family, sensor kinase